MEQISSYVLANKTTRFCLLASCQEIGAFLYMSILPLIHPTSKLDPYWFVIDYALRPRRRAVNYGPPGDMAIIHGPTWSEVVIERKGRDQS